jgi:hypothetical protein
VPRRFHQILFTGLLVLAIGGPWPILQSVAWVKMFVAYSQTDTLSAALTKTFNGRNQCNLCRFVAKGKKAESKESAQVAKLKIDFFLVTYSSFVQQPVEAPCTLLTGRTLASPLYSPPTPPPRLS